VGPRPAQLAVAGAAALVYLVGLLAPLLILLIAVTILNGFAPLRALGQNWLLLFTAFLPALAIMILLNNVAEEIGWGRIRLRPIPRSSWSAPRRLVDDSIFLAVPRTELRDRFRIARAWRLRGRSSPLRSPSVP